MKGFVAQAEATLAGRVHDWRVAAKDNAHAVVALATKVQDAERRRDMAEAETPAELDAARRRQQTAEQTAAAAVADRIRLTAELAAAQAEIAHVRNVGRDLAGRIVRLPGQQHQIVRDSDRVVEKFQAVFGRDG